MTQLGVMTVSDHNTCRAKTRPDDTPSYNEHLPFFFCSKAPFLLMMMSGAAAVAAHTGSLTAHYAQGSHGMWMGGGGKYC
ncbi:MAG TPA: hypothetical protein VF172_05115 [Nitrososphaera sp.]